MSYSRKHAITKRIYKRDKTPAMMQFHVDTRHIFNEIIYLIDIFRWISWSRLLLYVFLSYAIHVHISMSVPRSKNDPTTTLPRHCDLCFAAAVFMGSGCWVIFASGYRCIVGANSLAPLIYPSVLAQFCLYRPVFPSFNTWRKNFHASAAVNALYSDTQCFTPV